ncbi:MAG: hypothetical protein AB1668_02845 [Nanoarchaeota archaeon]
MDKEEKKEASGKAEKKEKATVTSKVGVKKKLWYRIIAPKLFGQKELGEIYLSSPEVALGRVMKINLRDITGNVKDQNIYIDFKVNAVDGSVLRTSVIGYELTSIYVKKMVRQGTNRIDDTFYFQSKTGEKVTVKCLIITLYKTQRSLRTAMRRQLQFALEEEIKNSDFPTFIGDLVSRKILNEIRRRLHKIYPIKEVALRLVSLKGGKAAAPESLAETSEKGSAVEEAEKAAGKETKTETTPKIRGEAAPEARKGVHQEETFTEGTSEGTFPETEEINPEAAKP